MATRLKDTDVVVIGLGAAGGVAVLPLAQAGLEVIGLEAGGAMTRRDFAPDEIRNNVRGWPMLTSHKTNQEAPTVRATASANAVQGGHPMMNAIGGTSLHYWAQHWRLNPWDFKVVSETKRRYGASRIPKGSTVEDWPFGTRNSNRITTRSNTNWASRARPETSTARSIRAAIPSKVLANANTRCRRYVGRRFTKRWRAPRKHSAGIRSPGLRPSIREAIRTARVACTTASARRVAVMWTPRTRRPSPRSRARRRRTGSRP